MKLTKPFRGVPDGQIYPVQYQPGDDCPPELQGAAKALGALEPEAAIPDESPAKPTRTKK